MRIAFCGHSHHRRTGSSRFLIEALRGLGTVEEHWVDDWSGRATFDPTPLTVGHHDAVVIWQMESVALRLAEAELPNVTFFPMYDSCHAYPDSFWRRLSPIKVASFSSFLHARLQRLGVRVRFARYYPEVPAECADGGTLAGFFWPRQRELTWATIRELIGHAPFDRFTIHDAPDPGCGELGTPSSEEALRLRLRTTRWFPSHAEARADLLGHNVYFAPRPREGIGMSFLEALAMGFLVVAPDRPTMNEYIVSGVNGLLYDPEAPLPLNFSRHREIGLRARSAAEFGRERWCRSLPALLDLVATPARQVPSRARLEALDPLSVDPGEATRSTSETAEVTLGDFIAFLRPPDSLSSRHGISLALRDAPPDANLVVGHHLTRDEQGDEELWVTADPATAYAQLRRGEIGWSWIEAFPAPAATLWRLKVARRLGQRAGEPLAREEALLRAVREGYRVHHALDVLATLPRRRVTLGERLRVLAAWHRLALEHTDRPEALARSFERMRSEAQTRDLHGLTAPDLALRALTVPGALKELKRRFRAHRARLADGRPDP